MSEAVLPMQPRADVEVSAPEPTPRAEPASKRIGRLVMVTGSQVVAVLEEHGAEDERAARAQLGSLVKMPVPTGMVFGIVSGLSIPIPGERPGEKDLMIVEIELLGEKPGGENDPSTAFRRGVSCFPQLNDGLYTATHDDLAQVYAPPKTATARIGVIHQDRSVPAYVVTNDLLGKHFAIVGTTGCGKSCSAALILQAVVAQNPNAHIVMLDPHNEYGHAFGGRAQVLSPDNLELPFWLLEFEEILEILCGAQDYGSPEASILREAILGAKRKFLGDAEEGTRITVDTPVPYRLSTLVQLLDQAMGKLDKVEEVSSYQRLKARFQTLQSDPRYAFMFGGLGVRDNMDQILAQIFRIPVDGKPLTIIDLSGVPSEIVNVVASVLCRITFDFALWGDRHIPVMLVCEEAHRYAPRKGQSGFEPTKRALSRIAKEGRKYGVSLCLITQRPSELAPGILSQCNTIFAMRMTNPGDQEILSGALPESSLSLMEGMPSLGNAEAIAVGEGVRLPMRICFEELPEERRPRSATADFHSAWQQEPQSADFLKAVVRRWRQRGG